MTAGRLELDLFNPALDTDGDPYPAAKLYFYQAGTSIAQDVFTDDTLGHALANPLEADGAGRFVDCWGDITESYDLKLKTSAGALVFTREGRFPLAPSVGQDGTGVQATEFRTALGLGSAALEDIGTSGNNVPLLSAENTWGGTQHLPRNSTVNDFGIGYRRIPPASQAVDYTFVKDDSGTCVVHSGGTAHTYTIPPQVDVDWNSGTAILIQNSGAGVLTIARGAGVAMRLAGDATDQDYDMAQYGLAVLYRNLLADFWTIAGTGLS